MVEVITRLRSSPVLTPSSLPCLRGLPTINVTEGCAHGCIYCYGQGYANYPGQGRVVLFENTAEMVRAELLHKRRRPRRVYFSPSSDAFQPLPEVQEVTYQTMAVLLEAGIEVAFLTKGFVPQRFLTLFAKTPSLVHAQIGITTLNEGFWKSFEPGTARPAQRLGLIASLKSIGIPASARLDPLIPDLTDTDENLIPLLAELERQAVSFVAASYIFTRPTFHHRLAEQMRLCGPRPVSTEDWAWRAFADGQGGGLMIEPGERVKRFKRLESLAAMHGLRLHICTCKNPDLGAAGCQIAGSPLSRAASESGPTLFS